MISRSQTSPWLRMHKAALLFAVAALIWTPAWPGSAQEAPNGGRPGYPGPLKLVYPPGLVKVRPVQGSVFLIEGAGGNITMQLGDDGVLLVDTGLTDTAPKVLSAISAASSRPIRYILTTDDAPDHVGGNALLAPKGQIVAGGNVVAAIGASAGAGAAVVAYETVLGRMSAPTGRQALYPENAWPTETYTTGERKLYFDGEAIEMLHVPHATSDGNTIVFFRSSNVISSGDIFNSNEFPMIDMKRGGSIQGVLDGLNLMLQIAIPKNLQEGGTMIVPGHGRICDVADLAFYQEMVTIIRNRVQYYIDKGMTLEQIKAAHPAYDYEGEYGRADGPWTTGRFIDAVYSGLIAAKSAAEQ